MFFVLSKLLAYFVLPLSWVLILVLCALLIKRRRKFFLIAATAVLILFSNSIFMNWFAAKWDYPSVALPREKQYSCAILLGGFVTMDKDGDGLFNQSSDRFIQTVKLYKKGIVKKVVVTGGSGTITAHPLKYSSWVKQQMMELGVPEQDILVDDESRNTLENASMSKAVLQQAGLKPPYVLVTSSYHMRRAVWVFEDHEHMQVIPYPSHFVAGRVGLSLWGILPQASVLDLWSIYTKEVIGYYVYKLKAALG